jgi:hypothetical protein
MAEDKDEQTTDVIDDDRDGSVTVEKEDKSKKGQKLDL